MEQTLYLTANQVAARYGVSRTTVYDLVGRGDLPAPQHFGRAARWRIADLEAVDQRRGAQVEASR